MTWAETSPGIPVTREGLTMPDARPWHEPVMLEEVVELLAPALDRPDARIVDLTLGLGGHAAALLARARDDAKLLGLDRDPRALETATDRLAGHGERVVVRHARFSDLAVELDALGWDRVHV